MAKAKGPLHGQEARGSIAGLISFQRHKTGQQVHLKATPTDRKTTSQLSKRNRMRTAAQNWAQETQATKQEWATLAKELGMISGYNAYLKAWLLSTETWYRFGQAKFGQAKFGGPKLQT